MARNIGAVVAGIVVVGVVVFGLQTISSSMYPPPEGVDPFDPAGAEAFAQYVAQLPPMAWLLAGVAELIGAFLGALTAGRIASSRRAVFAGVIVGLAVVGSINNWITFTHPMWFMVGQVIAYPLVFVAVKRMLPEDQPTISTG